VSLSDAGAGALPGAAGLGAAAASGRAGFTGGKIFSMGSSSAVRQKEFGSWDVW